MTELPANLFEQQFFRFLERKGDKVDGTSRALLSRVVSAAINQHSCIDVTDVPVADVEAISRLNCLGEPGESKPFTLFDNKLYLSRYFEYERAVAALIIERNQPLYEHDEEIPETLGSQLTDLFGADENNRQKLAAFIAITRKLAIITGGPGTGKTSTVAKILDILHNDNPALIVRLAAPTGKASMRLADSLSTWAEDKRVEPQVQTIHRLLGMRRDGRSYRHDADNPIRADVLIIDEASMIDLMMMHRILRALQDHTRLILLGDPNQLPSVDTGNVLADLCAGESGYPDGFAQLAEPFVGALPVTDSTNSLSEAICRLDKTWRFEPGSSIAILAARAQSGSVPDSFDDTVRFEAPYQGDQESLLPYFDEYIDRIPEGDIGRLSKSFERTRILCSRRGGTSGVLQVNRDIETGLELLGLKQRDSDFYPGRPVIVMQNDYNLGLYNGDIGICRLLDQSGQYEVVFPNGDRIFASRLPEHETCFAMTIHKSQGSEFDHVVVLLSDETSDEARELINRELLYTAITRSRQRLTMHTSQATLEYGLSRSARRVSGMQAFLR